LIIGPEPGLAPVIPPLIVPIVQEKLLATEADKLILGPDPLHVTAVFPVVTFGAGFTVTVIV
jgi:hypothetical protein